MHCLEVIVKRNDEAAGREAGHAITDKDYAKYDRIAADGTSREFSNAYLKARKEG